MPFEDQRQGLPEKNGEHRKNTVDADRNSFFEKHFMHGPAKLICLFIQRGEGFLFCLQKLKRC